MFGCYKIKSGCGKVKIDFFCIGKYCWLLLEESGEVFVYMIRICGFLFSILVVRIKLFF